MCVILTGYQEDNTATVLLPQFFFQAVNAIRGHYCCIIFNNMSKSVGGKKERHKKRERESEKEKKREPYQLYQS